jgi:hypothetical protein
VTATGAAAAASEVFAGPEEDAAEGAGEELQAVQKTASATDADASNEREILMRFLRVRRREQPPDYTPAP